MTLRQKLFRMLGLGGVAAFSSRWHTCNRANAGAHDAVTLPAPVSICPRAAKPGKSTVVFAGGCFWGVQAVFQHVKGVTDATAATRAAPPTPRSTPLVSTGETGHAESVRVTFDPSQVTFGQLLKVFFSVAHDPTELNHQGNDEGTQYRSAVFFTDPRREARHRGVRGPARSREGLPRPHRHGGRSRCRPSTRPRTTTRTTPPCHPDNPYIMFNDAPKVTHLRQLFPDLYRGQRTASSRRRVYSSPAGRGAAW